MLVSALALLKTNAENRIIIEDVIKKTRKADRLIFFIYDLRRKTPSDMMLNMG